LWRLDRLRMKAKLLTCTLVKATTTSSLPYLIRDNKVSTIDNKVLEHWVL